MPIHTQRVLEIIRSTQNMSLPNFGKVEIAAQKSSATDVVTHIDRNIEEFLAAQFAQLDPSIGFVGEEFGGSRDAERFWLVDPIDGTAHFVRGIPFCTTMVALIERGKVEFAAIYDFVNDRMYHAKRGEGAFENGSTIRVSERGLASAYISFETNLNKGNNLETYLRFKKRATVIQTLNAGYEFALVASGKLEGRICLDPFGKDYDFAPGTLLVSEAGGVVANIGARDYDFRDLNFIAANAFVFDELTKGEQAMFPVST